MYYTYAHYRPDGTIFYIGKGSFKRAHSTAGRNTYWNRIVKKDGEFKVEILALWKTEKEAFDHEIFLIDTFRKMGFKLANVSSGGEGSSGYRHLEETKAKMREAHLGSNNHFFGRKHTEESKRKNAEAHIGNKNMFGKTHSEETREKIRQKRLCQVMPSGNRKGIILATHSFTGLEIVLDGSKSILSHGFDSSRVYDCVLGKRKTHKQFTFKRI